MSAIVRIFSSEEAAQSASKKLAEAGYDEQQALLPSQLAGQIENSVRAAREDGHLPGSCVSICIQSLQQGRSVVAVNAPFGGGQNVTEILESAGAISDDVLPVHQPSSPSPLSDFLGLPVLAKFVPATRLLNSSMKNKKSSFGLPLLSKNQRGASSSFGLKTLSASKKKTSSFGMPLLSKSQRGPSSTFGMKTLSAKKTKTSSFGFPLLSDNPAPLSSLFGMSLLSKKQ